MIVSNIFQFALDTKMILLGIIIGAIYGLTHTNIPLFNNRIYIAIADILFWVITSILIIYTINMINMGEYRLYLLISTALGYILERKTLGKLFAKIYLFVYNSISSILKKLVQSRIGKYLLR